MRRFLTLVAAVAGALVALLIVAFLRVGAKPCLDVINVEVTAACAVPQAAPWALWLSLLLGGLGGLLVARRALATR